MPKPHTVRTLITLLQTMPPDHYVGTEDNYVIEEAYVLDPADGTPFKVPVVMLSADEHPELFKRSPEERARLEARLTEKKPVEVADED